MLYEFGDVELDTGRHELRRAGAVRHVEPQVFAVLAHLLAHRDRVVTRDELLESVWGHRFLADSTLASRIKAARRAIGDSGSDQRLIRTVRGTGFRFVGDVAVQGPEPGSAATIVHDDAPVRRDELRRLRAALTVATSGRRRVVFIGGESGSGKSTLVTRLAEEAGGLPGVRVAIGRCVEHRGEGEPYLPVLDALARLCEGPERDGVVAVLRARAPTWRCGAAVGRRRHADADLRPRDP